MDIGVGAKQNSANLKLRVKDVLESVILATAVAGLLYFGYFQLAPWIWNQNTSLDFGDIESWQIYFMGERDGVELYALYALMFVDLLLVCSASYVWSKLAKKYTSYFLVLPFTMACVFLYSIGFHPPMSTVHDSSVSKIFAQSYQVAIAIFLVVALLYRIERYSARCMLLTTALILIPICFISTDPISWYDYSFVLAPALRLLHGAGISETYFQYDLWLSLIGLVWMKLKLEINQFQIVAQCAYYVLFLTMFAFSRRWFLDKRLPVFLLVAVVLMRIYVGPNDAVHTFPVTPLRLDMWLILLALVYAKGTHHWGVGLFCGMMLVLHKNFGIIYSMAYAQLFATLFIMDIVGCPGNLIKAARTSIRPFLKKHYINLTLVLLGTLVHYLLFKNSVEQGNFSFVSLGIGFVKIAASSFYWYVVVMLGLSFVLLLKLRRVVTKDYLATGFCLIYLVIGNSLYFFGRSHENNIVNISAVLVLLFFFLLDMVGCLLAGTSINSGKSFFHKNSAVIISITFILSISIWYGDSIARKVAIQEQQASQGSFVFPSEIPEQDVQHTIGKVRSLVGNSPKVYFVGDNDFLLNYYGGYTSAGYYNPVYSAISKTEFNIFLQGLLARGYYVVVDNGLTREVLPFVRFSYRRNIGEAAVIWGQ